MNKTSQFMRLWPQIYNKLKNPPAGVNLGSFPGLLPSIDKINIDSGRLQDNPQAIGYVSTEDIDNDGTLDVIHIASPRLEEALMQAGASLQDIQNLDQLDNNQLISILTPFVELLSHEMGHLNDFRPGQDNPFPGGESAADSAARSAVQQISVGTTNNKNKFDKTGSFVMNMKTLIILADLATKLDKKGATKVADHIEQMMEKYSQSQPGDVDYDRALNMPDPRADMRAEPGNIDFKGPLDRIKESIKGRIRPYGDPYTYDLNSDKTFTVATAPRGKEQVVGRVIRPGQGGYDLLQAEAVRAGLMEAVTPAATERAPVARPSEGSWSIIKELGLSSVPSSHTELETMADTMVQSFRDGMASLADRVTRAGFEGILGGGATGGVLKQAVAPLKSPTLTGAQAKAAWRNVQAVGASAISADQLEKFTTGIDGFESQMKKWYKSLQVRRLGMEMFGSQSRADDGDVDDFRDIREEEDKRNASEMANEKIEKIASLKEDYRKIFWFDANRPFNRSNTKFKR